LTADCFSKAVFATKNTQQYLTSHLLNNDNQKTWVAEIESEIVGAITAININAYQAELTGFYVLPRFQGQGIGKKLYKKALAFAGNRNLILDIYTHNNKTIAMYQKWGWQIDESRGDTGFFSRHWPEWPPGLEAKSVYMKLSRQSI